ncbi:MAG: PHP domain-containing protein [Oscillospiraceae bacterium]|nr:PHP domain-containing protein [Oscillospiraceae bacterium]
MLYQAHRGVSSEYPENTIPAFQAAVAQGYSLIELDPSVTKDGRIVLLHDRTLNRTARHPDGSKLTGEVKLADLTYAEAAQYDYGLWMGETFRGTRLPLLEEVLAFARQHNIPLKLDGKYQYFTHEAKQALFDLLRPYSHLASLTCSRLEEVELAVRNFPDMHIHYDGPVTREVLEQLAKLLPRERLTVWLPHRNEGTAWVRNIPFADKATADMAKQYGRLGIWIIAKRWHLADALYLGADIIETNGALKPGQEQGLLADMHCHTAFSHDSKCPIEDMFRAQRERGTAIFAVTDHCDMNAPDYDGTFGHIKASCDAVRALNEQYDHDCLGLRGVELAESFWRPEGYAALRDLTDYDVVVGSVHSVRYPGYERFYSQVDFSGFTPEQVHGFMAQYFADVKTMLLWTDMDVLAHLAGPLYDLSDKYGHPVDMSRHAAAIDEILRVIIARNIALELNTSHYHFENCARFDRELFPRYHALGGRRVTIGSDTHSTARAGADLARAAADLKAVGFGEICWFKDRRAHFIPI